MSYKIYRLARESAGGSVVDHDEAIRMLFEMTLADPEWRRWGYTDDKLATIYHKWITKRRSGSYIMKKLITSFFFI